MIEQLDKSNIEEWENYLEMLDSVSKKALEKQKEKGNPIFDEEMNVL